MQILERYFLRDANINLRDAKQDLRDARYALREFECDTPRGLYCRTSTKNDLIRT